MRKSPIPILALLATLLAFVRALCGYHWVRWVPPVPGVRGPRVFSCRIANAYQVFIGPLWLSCPMPWSRVMLESYQRSSPWLLPKTSGIRAALGFCLAWALVVAPPSAQAQAVTYLDRDSTLHIAWDAPVVAPDGSDAFTGFTAEAFNPDNPGDVFSTQNTLGVETTMGLLTNALPTSPFMVAVRAFDAGDRRSDRSNAIGPFVVRRAKVAPGAPSTLRIVEP
jgi:hypothetical protein